MNKQKDIPWNAISAFLKQEAGMQQKDELERWMAESDENPALLREIASTWQLTRKRPYFYRPEEDFFWEKLLKKIGQTHRTGISFMNYHKWIAAAAVLLLVFLTGIWLGNHMPQKEQSVYSTIVVPPGSRTQTTLPDGTTVWLNSGAKLRYPTCFSAGIREVYASGECYFEVAKDKKNRFVVHCADLSVQVFGTTFNIKENVETHETVISLLEGNIQVIDSRQQLVASLLPGKQLLYSEGKSVIRDSQDLYTLTSWINNSLIFEDQPLQEVANYLQGWYGVSISLNPELAKSKHRYTFKVKTESLREVLNMISVVTPIAYKIEGEKVTITYK